MLRGRLPVLRLGSRGPGGHQKSRVCVRKRLRSPCKCLQAFANVGECHEFLAFENGREFTQSCRFLATVTGIGRVLVAKRRSVVTFGLAFGRCVSRVPTITGIGRSLSQNADVSSLLDSRLVAASQKCQQSQGSGGSLSQNAKQSSDLDSRLIAASQKWQLSQGSGGSWSQNADLSFWICVWSPRLKNANNHKDRAGPGRETQNCRYFWTCVWSPRLKRVTVTGPGRNAELSSLLDLLLERREERG